MNKSVFKESRGIDTCQHYYYIFRSIVTVRLFHLPLVSMDLTFASRRRSRSVSTSL